MTPKSALYPLLASSALFAALTPASLFAVDYWWNQNGTATGWGGAGTWSTTDAVFSTTNSDTAAGVTRTTTSSDKLIIGTSATPFVGGATISVSSTQNIGAIDFVGSGGTTMIGSGTINFAPTGTITNSGAQQLTFNGVITGAATALDLYASTGQITLANSTGTSFGLLNVRTGRVAVNSQTAFGGTGTGNNTVVHDGATLLINSTSGSFTEEMTISGAGFGTNPGALMNGNASGMSNTLSGAITLAANSRIGVFNPNAGNTNALTLSGGISLGANTLTLNPVLGSGAASTITVSTVAITGTGGVIKTGTGTATLSAANTYSGSTTVSAGILSLTNSDALLNSPLDTAASVTGDASNGLRTNQTTLKLGGLSGTKNLADVFTTTTGGYGSVTAITLTTASGKDLTYSGIIDGARSLTKAGAGVQRLSGPNAYSGTTTVSGGVLLLDHATALPGGVGISGGTSNLTLSGGGVVGLTAESGNLSRNLGTAATEIRWTGSGGFAAFGSDRSVNLNSAYTWNATNFVPGGANLILGHSTADATITFASGISLGGSRTVQVENGSATVDAVISGNISGGNSGTTNILTKTGAGTLALAGNNSYWGETRVTAGTLRVGNGGTIGRLSINSASTAISTGATLAVNRTDAISQAANGGLGNGSAVISGAGSFAQIGSGTTTLTLDNTYSGGTSVTAGTLLVNGSLTSATNAVTVSSGGTLGGTGTIAGDTTVSGTLAPGSSGIGKINLAALTFNSGSNFVWQMNFDGTARGVNYDAVDTTGTLGGTGAAFNIVLPGTESFSSSYWQTSRTWSDIFGTKTIEGLFNSIAYSNSTGTISGPDGQTQGTFTFDGTDLVWSAIPEPSAFAALAGLGALGLAGLRRRRRA